MSREIEKMLRSLPLRRPSRELDDRVIRELRGGRSARWSGWLSAVSAAAAMLALGVSITAFVRTLPSSDPMYQEATVENRVNDGRPAHTDDFSDGSEASPQVRMGSDDGVRRMPQLRGEPLRYPLDERFKPTPSNRFLEMRPGGARIDRANGDRKQVQ